MPEVKSMPPAPVSIFRSEAMTLAQLYLQADAAYNCVSELGELVSFCMIIWSLFHFQGVVMYKVFPLDCASDIDGNSREMGDVECQLSLMYY